MDTVLGIDHVGLGVRDIRKMAAFYAEVFGMRAIAIMPEEDHPAIRGLLRSPAAVHSSSLLAGGPGALTLALFQAVEPPPRPIRADHRYGDIGVSKLTFLVADLPGFCGANAGALDLRASARVAVLPGWDDYRFIYASDPEGNLIELVLAANGVADAGPVLCSAGVAVTDLERSLDFYRDVVGLDRLIVPPHERFSGLLDEVIGRKGAALRSCQLGSSKGRGLLELVEVTKPRGRSIPFGTQWGDFGYLQLCLYGTDGDQLAAQVEAEGLDVLLPMQTIDDPAFPARFMYLRDPDGIPVEVLVYPPDLLPGAQQEEVAT